MSRVSGNGIGEPE